MTAMFCIQFYEMTTELEVPLQAKSSETMRFVDRLYTLKKGNNIIHFAINYLK